MLALVVGTSVLGCGAFNPAFLNLLDTEGTGTFASLDNAPGHVVIYFLNNAEVDERLLSYLESAGNLILTDAEKRDLRPRIRMRVLITFTNGVTQSIELIDGSSNLVDQRFDVEVFPDLNQNDLNNMVVPCEVDRIEIDPNSAIEVFIPVELEEYSFREIQDPGEAGAIGTYVLQQRIPPQFRALQMDGLDADGNVTVRRNIGVRDVPPPVPNPVCGSVIPISMNGVLTVPFLVEVTNVPSYDGGDPATVGGIGGRYEFIISVQ